MTRPETAHVFVCDDPECIVCQSWRDFMDDRAQERFVEYWRDGRLADDRSDGHSWTLTDFE